MKYPVLHLQWRYTEESLQELNAIRAQSLAHWFANPPPQKKKPRNNWSNGLNALLNNKITVTSTL